MEGYTVVSFFKVVFGRAPRTTFFDVKSLVLKGEKFSRMEETLAFLSMRVKRTLIQTFPTIAKRIIMMFPVCSQVLLKKGLAVTWNIKSQTVQ